jgi:hypothetical protein
VDFVISGEKLLHLFNRIPLAVQATDYSKHCKLRCRPTGVLLERILQEPYPSGPFLVDLRQSCGFS